MLFSKSLLVVTTALTSLVTAHPFTHDIEDRQVEVSVAPVADPVVVDAGGVYMRTTTLADGSIIGGYASGDGPNNILRVTKSTDGGASWSVIGSVDSGPTATRDIDNAFPLALHDGRILYAFRNHDRTPERGYTHYRITVCVSDDGGVTWRFLSHVEERAHNGRNGLWEPFLRIARDGAIQVYYSAENSDPDQDNIMRASRDGGLTWSGVYGMSGGDVLSRDGMIGIAEIDGNGNLM